MPGPSPGRVWGLAGAIRTVILLPWTRTRAVYIAGTCMCLIWLLLRMPLPAVTFLGSSRTRGVVVRTAAAAAAAAASAALWGNRTLSLHLLEAAAADPTNAVCLDGSPGAYYHHSMGSRNWLVHLQGGGWWVLGGVLS